MFTQIKPAPPHIQFTHESQTLHLMRSRSDHAAELMEGLTESLNELKAFMPWAHFDNTVESQTQRLKDLESQWNLRKDFTYTLFLTQDDHSLKFVGCIGMHLKCLTQTGVEIGYWIRTTEAGKGLCTLATRLIVYTGFEILKLRRMVLLCDTGNEASRRVMEKVGFQYEGTLRNGGFCDAPDDLFEKGWKATGHTFLYSMIPEDYQKLSWTSGIKEGISFPAPSLSSFSSPSSFSP